MKRVLIRFAGDNDFSWLMLEFGHIILRFGEFGRHWVETPATKEEIAELFNRIGWPLYEFFINENFHGHKDYLQIEEQDIFIDNEVDEKMLSYDQWGNGDSVCVDFGNNTVYIV